jgi:hypothetical protein
MAPSIGSLGVASHPALPVVKDLARNLGVAAGNRPNGEALVVVKQHQTKPTIDGLNIGIVHSGIAQGVLNVDAGLVNRNAWAPKSNQVTAAINISAITTPRPILEMNRFTAIVPRTKNQTKKAVIWFEVERNFLAGISRL